MTTPNIELNAALQLARVLEGSASSGMLTTRSTARAAAAELRRLHSIVAARAQDAAWDQELDCISGPDCSKREDGLIRQWVATGKIKGLQRHPAGLVRALARALELKESA